MAQAVRRFLPLLDRVLVERFLSDVKTKGGIMLPEKAQGQVVEAIVAIGPGARKDSDAILAPRVKDGYCGIKVVVEEREYFLFRDGDFLGKFDIYIPFVSRTEICSID